MVFDKTGTLTRDVPEVVNPQALERLPNLSARVFFAMASSSLHPKSKAIVKVLEKHPANQGELLQIESFQQTRQLVSLFKDQEFVIRGRLGQTELVYQNNVLASLTLRECLRPRAVDEIYALHEAGYDCWILSGDHQSHVNSVALQVGIPKSHAIGELTPNDKALQLKRWPKESILMIGDGYNDLAAMKKSGVTATHRREQTNVAERSDLLLWREDIGPLCQMLHLSKNFAHTHRRNLIFAATYNLTFISLAAVGAVTPLVAALAMPLSSLSLVAHTMHSLRHRKSTFTSVSHVAHPQPLRA